MTGWVAAERLEVEGGSALGAGTFEAWVGYVFEAPAHGMALADGPEGAVGDSWVAETPVTAYKRMDGSQKSGERLVLSLVRTALG